MNASLDGVWAKLERAKKHTEALNRYVRDALSIEGNSPTVAVKPEGNTGYHILYVGRVPEWSDMLRKIAVMCGDVVHNLRSALDHLVFQLAVLHTSGNISNPEFTQFPICDIPEWFCREAFMGRRPRLREIAPVHAAQIEGFQPYHGVHNRTVDNFGMQPLATLRDLSDRDKHRLLMPTMFTTDEIGDSTGLVTYAVFSSHVQKMLNIARMKITPIVLGAEVLRLKLPDDYADFQVDVAGHIRPKVSFPEGWSVSKAIGGMAALVVQIVREFEPAF